LLLIKAKNTYQLLKLFLKSFRRIREEMILVAQIDNFNHGRYGFQLINYLSKGGYHIFFFRSNKFLLRLSSYDRLIFKLDRISLWLGNWNVDGKPVDFLTFRQDGSNHFGANVRKYFIVDLNYFNPKLIANVSLPFYIHPLMNAYLHKSMSPEKQNKLFFYGEEDLYVDSKWVEAHFGLCSRKSVFNYLKASDLVLVQPESYEELVQKMNDPEHRNSFFFIDSKTNRIPTDQFCTRLGRFDFFWAIP